MVKLKNPDFFWKSPLEMAKRTTAVARKIPCKCDKNTSASGILAFTYIVVITVDYSSLKIES
jgi:hypothetical protein